MKQIIYSVVLWTVTGKKESKFLNLENAAEFALGAKKSGVLIAYGAMEYSSPEKYKQSSRKCVDYEPHKK